MWCLFIIFVCFVTVSSTKESHISPTIDRLIDNLKEQQWDTEESPCLEKALAILENVKNHTLWATWVWNANQVIPTGYFYGSWIQYGNFDQCMNPPWLRSHPQFKTQYCIADVILTNKPKKMETIDPYSTTEEYLNSPTITGLPVNRLYWGVCVPAACKPHSIAKITRVMHSFSSLTDTSPNITVNDCQVAGTKLQYPTEIYWFLLLISTLLIIAGGSTYYRKYVVSDDQPSDNLGTVITKSFCIVKNHNALMRNNKEEIKVLNGMRFITAAIIVSLHEMFFSIGLGLINGRDYEAEITGFSAIFLHLDIIVDTFLAMSGLLHIKGLLANPDKQTNIFKVLLKRYMRLIGPFALTIFYIASVSKYTGSGPVWYKNNGLESTACRENWGLSMLMLNSDPKYICHSVTWYLSCDYQLTVLGTVLFYFYKKNKRLGLSAFATAVVFSLIIPAILTYWFQLPVIHFMDKRDILHSIRNYWELYYTYTSSFSRAGSYLLGVAMAYLMTQYKPAGFRKSISKTWSIIGTGVSLTVMIAVLSLGKFFLRREYYPIEAAVTVAFNRVLWAVAICTLIGLCEYGDVPLVSNFLSSSIFTPLSRLSYGMYLLHPILIQRYAFTTRTPLKFDIYVLLTDTAGWLVISIGLSYVMWLLVEAPVINLSNHLLMTKSKSTEPSKVTEKNGIHTQNGVQKQNGHVKTKMS